MRDAFLFFRSFHECLVDLPEKNQLEIYKAIAEYSLYFKEPTSLTGISKSIWVAIEPSLKKSMERAKAGTIGGRISKRGKAKTRGKNKQNKANLKQTLSYKDKNKNKDKDKSKRKNLTEEDFEKLYSLLTPQHIQKITSDFSIMGYEVDRVWKKMLNSRIANNKPYTNWISGLRTWIQAEIDSNKITRHPQHDS